MILTVIAFVRVVNLNLAILAFAIYRNDSSRLGSLKSNDFSEEMDCKQRNHESSSLVSRILRTSITNDGWAGRETGKSNPVRQV